MKKYINRLLAFLMVAIIMFTFTPIEPTTQAEGSPDIVQVETVDYESADHALITTDVTTDHVQYTFQEDHTTGIIATTYPIESPDISEHEYTLANLDIYRHINRTHYSPPLMV